LKVLIFQQKAPNYPIPLRAQSLVFKRSVGYGGHQVIMGNTWNEHATQEKLRALTKASAQVSPADFLNWIIHNDSSCWIYV
jgi:hypothetical protein